MSSHAASLLSECRATGRRDGRSRMTDLLDHLGVPYELDVPLAARTWYGVGGPARVLAHPASVGQLSALAARAQDARLPVYVLGSGANLLVADEGVDGVVVALDDPAFRQVKIEGSLVTAGAGADLARLVLQVAKAGLAGLECMAGIPASLGGAVRMNAGGAFGDIGRSVRRLRVMDAGGRVYTRERDDLVFAYRKTNIVAKFVLEVELELTPGDPVEITRRVKEVFLYKKNSQPLAENSAGCAFKNPKPAEGAPGGKGPSAGKLIDDAGLKGYRVGGAEVSPHHANFVIAHRGCTAADILAVMDHVQRTVHERTGVALEREVVVWP